MLQQRGYVEEHPERVCCYCSVWLMARSKATEEDQKGLEKLKLVLLATDVQEVETDLATGNIKKSTIDKIGEINKQITEICLEHIQTSSVVRDFLKQAIHLKIENDKQVELMRLNVLKISVD